MPDLIPTCTALTMVRGENDIVLESLLHHCQLGFDRLIIISHVEHVYIRACVDILRQSFDAEINLIEIEDPTNFTHRKEHYINNALSFYLRTADRNVVYCFDADEFLWLGTNESGKVVGIHEFIDSLLRATDIQLEDLYLELPWTDLIPDVAYSKRLDPINKWKNAQYYQIQQGGGTKMLMAFRRERRIHMGYHWAVLNGTRINQVPACKSHVLSSGARVYHVPLRSPAQFFERLAHYKMSASPSVKYNVLSAISSVHGDDKIAEFFNLCCATNPAFSSEEEAKSYFGLHSTGADMRAFIAYLVSPRKYVGNVLAATI